VTSAPTSFVELCGELRVQLEGRAVEAALPGRQGRLLFKRTAPRRTSLSSLRHCGLHRYRLVCKRR
jgi:hypothetical protein